MFNYPCQNKIKITATIFFLLYGIFSLFAQEPGKGAPLAKEKNLTELQKEARAYRSQGLELQGKGNLEGALGFYQKAIELDPLYPDAYNDLGIIYERHGYLDRAEEVYLRCIKIDPGYLGAYTNLAFLYENMRDLGKAVSYWRKRVELGSPDDIWTQRAKQRIKDISLVMGNSGLRGKEAYVVEFMKDRNAQRIREQDTRELSKSNFSKAKAMFRKGDDVTALKLAVDAQQLDSSNNAEIEEFIDKVRKRLLSR